jgi:hypothetical protein
MDQIEATWEERNLGLRVLEITLDEREERDVVTAIGDASRDFDYTLIKVPSGNPGLVHELEELGFRFLETQLEIFKKLKSYEEPKGPILEEIQYQEVGSREGLDLVLEQIDEQMFVTDRVSLDPALGPQRWTPSVGPLGGISKVDSAVLVAASKGNSERGRA